MAKEEIKSKQMNLYHGTLDIHLQSIKDIGLKESDNINYKDYLGKGIYFYNNYKDAKKWASKKASHFSTGYAIIKANVEYECNKCLNFSYPYDSERFMNFIKKFLSDIKSRGEVVTYPKDKRKEFSFFIDCYCCVNEIDIVIAFINVSNDNTKFLDDFYLQYKIIPIGEQQYCVKNKQLVKNICIEKVFNKEGFL